VSLKHGAIGEHGEQDPNARETQSKRDFIPNETSHDKCGRRDDLDSRGHTSVLAKGRARPPWVKLERSIRYAEEDVLRYIERNRRTPSVRAYMEEKNAI
jgi:hypothetical protein